MDQPHKITLSCEEDVQHVLEMDELLVQQMLDELQEDLENDIKAKYVTTPDIEEYLPDEVQTLDYFITKQSYNNDALYYDHEYSVKELLKITEYYGFKDIRKYTQSSKKKDIISFLVAYEQRPQVHDIVQHRHRMWAYIEELRKDDKLKKHILWV